MLNPETQALREVLSRIITTDSLDRAKELAIAGLQAADSRVLLLPIGYQFELELDDAELGRVKERHTVIAHIPSSNGKLTNQWQIEVV